MISTTVGSESLLTLFCHYSIQGVNSRVACFSFPHIRLQFHGSPVCVRSESALRQISVPPCLLSSEVDASWLVTHFKHGYICFGCTVPQAVKCDFTAHLTGIRSEEVTK